MPAKALTLSERAPHQALLDLAIILSEPDHPQPDFLLTVIEDGRRE